MNHQTGLHSMIVSHSSERLMVEACVQVASLSSIIAGLQTELSRARLALADAMRQASNREEQHRAAVNDLTTSGAQQLEAAQAQTQQALAAAAAQHATQLQSLHTAATSTEQLLQARIRALQDGEQHLAKQCSTVQQQLSDEQGRHEASVQAHEAQLAEAAALLVAAQQASGMQLALADSGQAAAGPVPGSPAECAAAPPAGREGCQISPSASALPAVPCSRRRQAGRSRGAQAACCAAGCCRRRSTAEEPAGGPQSAHGQPG